MAHLTVPVGIIALTGKNEVTTMMLATYALTVSSAAGFLYLGDGKEFQKRSMHRLAAVGVVYLLATLSNLDIQFVDSKESSDRKSDEKIVRTGLTFNVALCAVSYLIDYIEINKIIKKNNEKLAFHILPNMDLKNKTQGLLFSLTF
jgi:hypothetical protein